MSIDLSQLTTTMNNMFGMFIQIMPMIIQISMYSMIFGLFMSIPKMFGNMLHF